MVIVFSKNRPAQLDLLLTSIDRFGKRPAHVIYKPTTREYVSGYSRCMNLHPQHEYIKQSDNFKKCLITTINAVSNKSQDNSTILFLADDDIFINDARETRQEYFLDNCQIASYNLRLHPYIRRSWTMKVDCKRQFVQIWKWPAARGEWGYPMGVGSVFLKHDIMPILKNIQFNSPNTMEGRLAHNPIKKNRMACPDIPTLINIPANKVQSDNKLGHMNISPVELNNKFLSGKRISLLKMIEKCNIDKLSAPHVLLKYEWE